MTRMLRWMSAYPWVAPVAYAALVVALVWFGIWRDKRNSEALGKAKGDVARLRTDSVRLAMQARVTDTLYTRDTLRLTRVTTRYQTLRDSVLVRPTDTVLVRETIQAGDATIKACRDQALATCEQRVADRDAQLANAATQRLADQRLFAARLRLANPRLTPYVEAAVNPFDTRTIAARAGVELRVFGPLRLISAFQFTTAPSTSAALVGVRVTF